MDKLITSLLQIEHSLRLVREELSQKLNQIDAPELAIVDFGALTEITPSRWRQWFTAVKYSSPTPVGRYVDIFPDLLLGYPATTSLALNAEQNARIDRKNTVLHSLHLWMIEPIEWLTLELRIPDDIHCHFKTFYFAWSVFVDSAQLLKLWIYEKSAAGGS